MNVQLGNPVDSRQHVDVARDQRALGDDAHLESGMIGEHLEYSPGHPEPALARLIWIGRRADYDRLAFEKCEMPVASMPKRARENFRGVVLYEDIPLECEPWRHLLISIAENILHSIAVVRALHHVPVSVARVTIGTAERAPDIRIDRPESHSRDFRTVQNVLRR